MFPPEDNRPEGRRASAPAAHIVSNMPSFSPYHEQQQDTTQSPEEMRLLSGRRERRSSTNTVSSRPAFPRRESYNDQPRRLRRASIRLMRTPSGESWNKPGPSEYPLTEAVSDDRTTRRRSSSEPRAVSSNLLTAARRPRSHSRSRQPQTLRLVRESSELGTSAVNGPGTRYDAATDLSTVLEHMQTGQEGAHHPPRVSVTIDNEPGPGLGSFPSRDGGAGPDQGNPAQGEELLQVPEPATTRGRTHSLSGFASFRRNRASTVSGPVQTSDPQRRRSRRNSRAGIPGEELDNGIVNLLDAIDPEVSTLTTLTNVQNSLFVPNLGSFLNRRPTYYISRSSSPDVEQGVRPPPPVPEQSDGEDRLLESPQLRPTARRLTAEELDATSTRSSSEAQTDSVGLERTRTTYMILPDGVNVDGWTEEEKAQLNDHVRHMLHSRRSKFRRGLKGFGQYVSKPLGFLVTLYAVLITLFGLAWVLFLIGWINVGGRQLYIINVIDNVLVALFAIMGDGLAPFRAVDTYHMIFIAHYGHLTWKRRRQLNMKKLKNKNDLPTRHGANLTDIDGDQGNLSEDSDQELSVLTLRQQERLMHHQRKFANSHTFYKPHETGTHYAFSLNLLIAIVLLLDMHSCFQIALGACTWGIYYKNRPFALTTVILCCSIACNITAGILIWVGDRKSRKVEVIKRMFRQELTGEAIRMMEKKKKKHEKKALKQERKSLALSRKERLSGESIRSSMRAISRSASKSRKRMSSPNASEDDTIAREKSPNEYSFGEDVSRQSSGQGAGSTLDASSYEERYGGRGRENMEPVSPRSSFAAPRYSIGQRLDESGAH